MEEWVPIPEFPGYSIDTLGRVRKDSDGHLMAMKENQYGVVYVGLTRNYTQYQRSVARLVAKAFVKKPPGPFDTPINLNGDRYDNHVENLAWRPRWFAIKYNQQFRNRFHSPIERPIRDLKTGEVYADSFECAVRNGLLESDVVLSILNRTFTAFTYQQFGVVES